MTAARLPDGRRISIATALFDRLSCGVVVLDEASAGDPMPLAAEVAALEGALRARYAGSEPSAIDGLREARSLYKSCGMDPSRHRPSSEALLRRVLLGKGLYRLGSVVDTCNLASLGFLLPIGLYDLAKVCGDVELRLGAAGEQYDGIRKDLVHVGGRLALFDDAGPFGSPSSDSLRTSTDDGSRTLLAVVMATAAYPPESMTADLDSLTDLFSRHCGAKAVWRTLLGTGGGV